MPLKIGNNKIKELYLGNQKIKEVYVGSYKVYSSVKQYTLTLASGVSANRTSSPSGYGSIGAITSGSVIFEGDTLTLTGAAKASTYTDWSPASITAPTVTPCLGTVRSAFVDIDFRNIDAANLYRQLDGESTWVDLATWISPDSMRDDTVSFGELYYYKMSRTSYRTRTDYTPVVSPSSSITVSGNVNVTLSYNSNNVQESKTIESSIVEALVPPQTTYAITFTKGTGISSIFVSTNVNATSGSASGTKYGYGTTVYVICSVSSGYTGPSGWSYNSSTGYYYKSYSMTASRSVGTVNAVANTVTVTFNTSTSVTSIVITKPDNTTVIADSTGFMGNPSQPVTINLGQSLKWTCNPGSGYYIPSATTTTRTFNSNATITPTAAQVTTTSATLSSRNQVRMIMEAAGKFVTQVKATNNKSGNANIYAGWSSSMTTSGTTWWNGTSFAKNTSKTVYPNVGYTYGYFNINTTTSSPNWSIVIYTCTNDGWNFG